MTDARPHDAETTAAAIEALARDLAKHRPGRPTAGDSQARAIVDTIGQPMFTKLAADLRAGADPLVIEAAAAALAGLLAGTMIAARGGTTAERFASFAAIRDCFCSAAADRIPLATAPVTPRTLAEEIMKGARNGTRH